MAFTKSYNKRHLSINHIRQQQRKFWLQSLVLVIFFILPSPTKSDINVQICMKHCEDNRDYGERQAFQINCDDFYSDSNDLQNCKNKCDDCPDWICDSSKTNNIYNCPGIKVNDTCDQRCETNRKVSSLETFDFECNTVYQSEKDKEECRKDCDQCPWWICDARRDKYGPDHREAFTFSCLDKKDDSSEMKRCQDICGLCDKSICDPFVDNNKWHCPVRLDIGVDHPEYEGQCKARCDKHRLGGTNSYDLFCDKINTTKEEELLCQDDCKHCPTKICDWKTQFSLSQPQPFHCPDSPEADGHKAATTTTEAESTLSPLFIAAIVIAAILTVGGIVTAGVCCFKKRRTNNASTPAIGTLAGSKSAQYPVQMQYPMSSASVGGGTNPPTTMAHVGSPSQQNFGPWSYPTSGYVANN